MISIKTLQKNIPTFKPIDKKLVLMLIMLMSHAWPPPFSARSVEALLNSTQCSLLNLSFLLLFLMNYCSTLKANIITMR